MSKTRNLKFSEGETWVIEATFTDSVGEVLDITDGSVEWVVATRPGQSPIVTATTGNALISIVDAEAGRADITVPYASHSAAVPQNYQHECRVTLANGETSVQFKGRLVIEDSLFVV